MKTKTFLCVFVAVASIATLVEGIREFDFHNYFFFNSILLKGAFDAACAKCLCHIQTNCNNNHPAGPYKIR